MKKFIVLLHPLGLIKKIRIDFKSEKPATDFIELLKLDGYKVFQYILSDFTYGMSADELKSNGIRFTELHRERKTWFGLFKKQEVDLLIEPTEGFYYPYQYGSYLYLFSKKKYSPSDIEKWLDQEFPNRFADLDETFGGSPVSLLNEDDYLIATNHDYQEEFGLIGTDEVIEQVLIKLDALSLEDYEIENYIKN